MISADQLQRQLKQIWRRENSLALERSGSLLRQLAARLREAKTQEQILLANRQDLAKLQAQEPLQDPLKDPLKNPIYDRLLLNEDRLQGVANDLDRVATLPGPVGQELYRYSMPNGAEIVQRRVPIGLILVIYESRPNVTIDLFALALRTGNVLLLKGGKEAWASNSCLVGIIRKELQAQGLSPNWANLLGTSREELVPLLEQRQYIDLCIPRGSAGLIRFVRENSQIPLIETGAGVVHLFCDDSARIPIATALIYNSKMRRPSVCNALDCLLVHQSLLPQLSSLVAELAPAKVRLHCDEESLAALRLVYPAELLQSATPDSYGQEFLSAQLCIRIVRDLHEAIEHIEHYGSRHTEVIVTENQQNAEIFCHEVDAASVFVNMASGFSDGGQFGLGAEVGISTQKLHARGPMGLTALTCAKWFGLGRGQIRD